MSNDVCFTCMLSFYKWLWNEQHLAGFRATNKKKKCVADESSSRSGGWTHTEWICVSLPHGVRLAVTTHVVPFSICRLISAFSRCMTNSSSHFVLLVVWSLSEQNANGRLVRLSGQEVISVCCCHPCRQRAVWYQVKGAVCEIWAEFWLERKS